MSGTNARVAHHNACGAAAAPEQIVNQFPRNFDRVKGADQHDLPELLCSIVLHQCHSFFCDIAHFLLGARRILNAVDFTSTCDYPFADDANLLCDLGQVMLLLLGKVPGAQNCER